MKTMTMADNSRIDGDTEKAVKVKDDIPSTEGSTEKVVTDKIDNRRTDRDIGKNFKIKSDNSKIFGDPEKAVKVKDDISSTDGRTEKAMTDRVDNSEADSDIGKTVKVKADNSRIFGGFEKAVQVKNDISSIDGTTEKAVTDKVDNSKTEGDTGKTAKVKADNSRIDGDIEKTVKAKLLPEIAEDEGVSDELYTNLYSWLCGAIQQERNHWKRQIDVTLQALNQHHKETLTHQTKLQTLLSKLDPNAQQSFQNDQNGHSEENFEEKEVPSTQKLLEELEAKLDIILDLGVCNGGKNSETHSSQTRLCPTHGLESKPKSDDKSVLLAESRGEGGNGPHLHQYLEHRDNNSGNQHVGTKTCSVPQLTQGTNSQDFDNDLMPGSTENIVKDNKKIPTEKLSPEHLGNDAGVPPLCSNVPDSQTDQNDDGHMENSESRSKPLNTESQGKAVPISNYQVWSSVQRGANHGKPYTHPYLKRSSPTQLKETFSVKKLTSLSQDERQKYEKAIQSKKTEIKYLRSDLEEAMDQIQKLQKVIQRLYILNRHLNETPRGVKDSSNAVKDTSTNEKNPQRVNKDAPRNKKDIPTNMNTDDKLSGAGKKTEKQGISTSMPSLNSLPVFQAMPGAEMALWKLRVKQRNIQGKKTEVAQCLRCQRLFRLSENNNISCRYHRNGQQTVEKYDTNGKLVQVVYKWACCQRKVDAPGCTHSQHI